MKAYDHKKIEKKWQTEWEKKKIYQAKDKSTKKKFYPLVEFPFPSGSGLHTGHIRSYTAMDIVTRKHRMQDENVLYPMGWDAFGLPTENYALKTGISPKVATKQNTDNFRRQLKSLGFSFDWSREVNTTDPEYYRWTQWIFLQMYKKGLAYKDKIEINWCPKDKIGLANEEVIDGKCERCGTPVEKRLKEQWMLAITKYADRLYDDLDTVDYLERIKIQQRNWIGRSEGMLFTAPVKDTNLKIQTFSAHFEAFVADTFVVIAPDHPFLVELVKGTPKEKEVLDFAKKLTMERVSVGYDERESQGIFTGRYIVDPIGNGDLPIWVASYALADYGTGIVKCSAHDERDFAFAKKYNIPLKEVLEPLFIKKSDSDGVRKDLPLVERRAAVCVVKHWNEDKYLCLKWKQNDWQGFVVGGIDGNESAEEAGAREIREETGYQNPKFIRKLGGVIHSQFYHEIKKQNRFAHFSTLYFELIDDMRKEMAEEEKSLHEVVWVSKAEVTKFVSRDEDMEFIWKRFSLPPFPWTDMKNAILTEPKEFSGKVAGDMRQEIIEYLERNKLAVRKTSYKLRDWIFSRQRYWGEPIPMIHCEKCGYVPVPEKDLPVKLPEVKKYEPTDTGESPLANISTWVNVKCPKCKGQAKRETDTMPNWAGSSWYYLRYIDPKNKKAFADRKKVDHFMPVDWYNGGMEHTTLHLLYSRFWHKFLFDEGLVNTGEPYKKRTSHGLILALGGEKMSKSKGNVVSPDELVATYGADTLRLYEMFIGPFDQSAVWNTESIIGPRRFVERVWKLQEKVSDKAASMSLLHKTIKKVGEDIEAMSFNTVVSSLMVLANAFEKENEISRNDFESFLKLLAPFAPHITEDMWRSLGNKTSIHISEWPQYDESLIKDTNVKIAVQVNGKVRAVIELPAGADEGTAKTAALALPEIQKWLAGKVPTKTIYVKGRVVNFIIPS
jgi:leucyl-tRNA synthetase